MTTRKPKMRATMTVMLTPTPIPALAPVERPLSVSEDRDVCLAAPVVDSKVGEEVIKPGLEVDAEVCSTGIVVGSTPA